MLKLSRQSYEPLGLLALMAILAFVTAHLPKIALPVGLGVLAIGFYQTLRKRNRNGEAHLYAGFIVGAEVYFRMSFAGLPWEFGKIAVFILLLTGLAVEKGRKPVPIIFLIYLLLLLPGVFIPDWESMQHFKKEFMFTFFGEIVLVVSALYFYKRTMSVATLQRFVRWMVLGVVLTSILLFFKTPDYASIHYGGGSNFAASGGFGPNQVSAILGLGMTLAGYSLLSGMTLFGSRLVDVALLLVFTLQGLFTLSRGGMMAAVLALLVGVVALYLFNAKEARKLLHIRLGPILFIALLTLGAFNVANTVSSGAVERRYLNVDRYGNQIKADYTTNRGDIVKADWQTFLQNSFTGVGIGGARKYRAEETGISAAHVELSRLPAEHGILGFLALLIILFYPVFMFFRVRNAFTRFTITVFTAYAVLTMTHNAMRLALPSFLYGAGFIWIILQNRSAKLTDRE